MGSLIRTKGTIRIARFLTEAFSGNMAYWRANAILFDTGDPGWVDLWNVINAQPLLQLPAHPLHPNLPGRWQWFMTTGNAGAGALTQANHNAIANGIHQGVTAVTPAGGPAYRGIIFDAIEGGTQTVLTPHAVTIPTVAGAWWPIVLQTPAMPAGSPGAGVGSLDPEFNTNLNTY
jgi:hypothetical protein